MGYFSVISGLICLLSIMRTGETSKMYNIHEVITMASFDKPTVRKDEAARFVCQYGAMMEFGEERFHAIILFPNGKRFISDMLQYKPEGIEVDYNEVENSFEMKIAHVKMSHAGEYGCTYMVGSNANHDVKIVGESPTRRDSLRVIVGTSPPTIEEFSNNENKVNKNNNTGSKVREVRVGQLRNLTCVVRQSYPQADIEWTDERGNSLHEIPTIYFHTQTLNSSDDGLLLTKSTMSFTPSRDQDKQKVVCRAKNEADLGFKNDTIILSVLYAPIAEVSISPKLIDEDTPKVTALCKTSSNPPIDQFKWYIGSRLIEKETSNTLVLQGINQDSYKDTVIKCEAINALGSSKKASGELNFIRKPEFTKIPNVEYKVILGDEVRMECAAEGHPSPRIEWLREGYDRVLSYEETLVVNSADFSSAGVYICRAVVNNMYLAESRARVTVFGPPSLLATRRKYSKIGSMATLECSVSTRVTKPTNMYWRHNELKFEEGQFVNKYIVEKKEMNDSWTLLLTILDLKEENFGDYNCTVFNHAGNDTVTVSLLQPPLVPQDEMSIIIMGSCVAGALIILLFAIVIALICYCQQGPKGGKHHPVDQKPPPDLPPSYRRDISSPTHHIGMPPPQMPPPAIPTHQMQQDYVDMDGVLMGGAGLGALGGTPPPPPPQLYPTMMSQRGGNQTFYGSRADDINSIEDGCKSWNQQQPIYGAAAPAPVKWREFESHPGSHFLQAGCAPQYIYPPFYQQQLPPHTPTIKLPSSSQARKTNYPVFYPTLGSNSTVGIGAGGFPAPPTPPVFNPLPPQMPAVFSPAILASQRSFSTNGGGANGSQRSISPPMPMYTSTNYAPSPTDSNGAFFRSNSTSYSRPLLASDSSSNTQTIYQPTAQF